MAVRLLVLSSAGLPLLSSGSSSPHLPPLPFATTGLTSALLSSCNSHDHPLTSLLTSDARISVLPCSAVVLVLCSNQSQRSAESSLGLLRQLEDALVLLIGRAALEEQKAMERLKRKLRSCAPLLRCLLHATAQSSSSPLSVPVQVGLPEAAERPPASSPLSSLLDGLLTSLSTACSTQHVALYLGHRLLLPSSHFALLHPADQLALSSLLLCPPPHPPPPAFPPSSFDLVDQPIFLCHSMVHGQRVEGRTAYRLLHQRLNPTLSAVLLCGPSPSTAEAQRAIDRVWATEQRGLADWDGAAEVGEEDTAADEPRVARWIVLVMGKKVTTGGARQRGSWRGTTSRRGSGCSGREGTPTRGGGVEEVDEEAQWSNGHSGPACGELVEEVDDAGSEEADDDSASVEQLMSFYHSSAEVVQAEGGEAYMQLHDADLWAVRSGEVALYARVVGCSTLQQSRSCAHSTLRKHLDRRRDRSSIIAVRAPHLTAASAR